MALVLKRRASNSSADIRLDDQFKYGHASQRYLKFFDLAYRLGWTEIPLLSHNFFN